MKHKILVIDDDWTDRQNGYRRLEEACRTYRGTTPSGFDIELDFLPRPLALPNFIKNNVYSAYIVDVILDDNPINRPEWLVPLRSILDQLGAEVPIALVSVGWDRTNIEQVNAAWAKPNCRTFLRWEDIKDEKRHGGLTQTLWQLSKVIHEYRGLAIGPSLEDGDPIRILHLSDLQFGGVDQSKLGLEANFCADAITREWGLNGPTFIVITGDIAEHGLPEEYQAAETWLDALIARFTGFPFPSRQILLVPGNHDVCLPLAVGPRISLVNKNKTTGDKDLRLGSVDERRTHLTTYALRPYQDFAARVTGRRYLQNNKGIMDTADLIRFQESLTWVEGGFRHLGVIFYGLNTARPLSSTGLPGRQVHPGSLNLIKNELQRLTKEDQSEHRIHIALTHHCPLSAHADRGITNPDVFEPVMSAMPKTALCLYGHAHERKLEYSSSAGRRVIMSLAPSLTAEPGKLPPDSLRGFTMLELTRKEGDVKTVQGWHYEFSASRLQKRLDEYIYCKEEDGTFRQERIE